MELITRHEVHGLNCGGRRNKLICESLEKNDEMEIGCYRGLVGFIHKQAIKHVSVATHFGFCACVCFFYLHALFPFLSSYAFLHFFFSFSFFFSVSNLLLSDINVTVRLSLLLISYHTAYQFKLSQVVPNSPKINQYLDRFKHQYDIMSII